MYVQSGISSPQNTSAHDFQERMATEGSEPIPDMAVVTNTKQNKGEEKKPPLASIGTRTVEQTLPSSAPKDEVVSVKSEVDRWAFDPHHALEERATNLWDVAYARLKVDESDMMLSYEMHITHSLLRYKGFHLHPFQIVRSIVDRDPSKRRAQMRVFIDNWLKDAGQGEASEPHGENSTNNAKSDEDKSVAGDEDEARALRSILRTTLQESPDATLPWAASCLTLETLLRSTLHPEPDHEQIISIVSRIIDTVSKMAWYNFLFNSFVSGTQNSSDFLGPDEALIHLYKVILSDLIRHFLWLTPHLRKAITLPEDSTNLSLQNDIQSCEAILQASFDRYNIGKRLTELFENIQKEADSTVSQAASSAEYEATIFENLLLKLHVVKESVLCPTDKQDEALECLYNWARTTQEYKAFTDWSKASSCRVLWVNGVPGAGKTKLLQAAVSGLPEEDRDNCDSSSHSPKVASFFCDICSFCQVDALSTVKALIFSVLKGQPSLHQHLSSKFGMTRRKDFDNANDFYAMSTVLYSLILDAEFVETYFVVDGIEQFATVEGDSESSTRPRHFTNKGVTNEGGCKDPEDEHGLNDLLKLISITLRLSDKVRWMLSVDQRRCNAKLELVREDMQLSLVIDSNLEAVREAANKFAVSRIAKIADEAGYSDNLRAAAVDKLQAVSQGNFMWLDMALGIVEATSTPWNAPEIIANLNAKTPDVESLYRSSMQSIGKLTERDKTYCTDILKAAAVAYRPLRISELVDIIHLPQDVDACLIVRLMLHSFLETRDHCLYFKHFSARDFIRRDMRKEALLNEHSKMTQSCLGILVKELDNVQPRKSHVHEDGVAVVHYATLFWIKHLSELGRADRESMAAANGLFDDYLMQWLEVLDSRSLLPEALDAMAKLYDALTIEAQQPIVNTADILLENIRHVTRFTQLHQAWKGSTRSPELTWADGEDVKPKNSLLFCPTSNPLRERLLPEYFPWLATAPVLETSGELDGCLHTMFHEDWVRGCCFSADGRLVASCSDDNYVRLWDVEKGTLQQVFGDFDGYVFGVAISRSGPDDGSILAACQLNKINVWEVSTCKPLIKGLRIVVKTGNNGGDVRLYGLGPSEIRDVAVTQAGDRLAAATGTSVAVWEIPGFGNGNVWPEDVRILDSVRCVRFSPDGSRLASSAGSEITIRDSKTGQPLQRLPVRIPQLQTPEDALGLPKSSGDIMSEDQTLDDKVAGHSDGISGLAFSPDSKFLASGSDDLTARIWNLQTGTTAVVLQYHTRQVTSVSFSADGTRLATGSADTTIAIWEQKTAGDWGSGGLWTRPDRVLNGHTAAIVSVSFAPHGGLLASASNDQRLRIWNTDIATDLRADNASKAQQVRDESTAGDGHRSRVSCVAFSADEKWIASASLDGVVCLWDGETGARQRTMDVKHDGSVTSLVFSRGLGSSNLISTSVSGEAFIWDVSSTEAKIPKYRLEGHTDWIQGAAVSCDGRLVATASDDKTVRIWDIHADGAAAASTNDMANQALEQASNEYDVEIVPLAVFRGHKDYVYGVSFSPDDKFLVSAGDDVHVMIWNLDDDRRKQKDKHKPDVDMSDAQVDQGIRGVLFTPDGRNVVSVSHDGTVAIWNPELPQTEQCLLVETLETDNTLDFGLFHSMNIDAQYPEVLLTETGAWPFVIGGAVLRDASTAARSAGLSSASTCSRLSRRQRPPAWCPLGITRDRKWITWNNEKLIFLPKQFRPPFGACCVQGHSVVVGCRSGQVLLFRFRDDMDPMNQ